MMKNQNINDFAKYEDKSQVFQNEVLSWLYYFGFSFFRPVFFQGVEGKKHIKEINEDSIKSLMKIMINDRKKKLMRKMKSQFRGE